MGVGMIRERASVVDKRAKTHHDAFMRTTLDIPDDLFRQVKAAAAGQGISLKAFLNTAVMRSLCVSPKAEEVRGWKACLGTLPKSARKEAARIGNEAVALRAVDEELWK